MSKHDAAIGDVSFTEGAVRFDLEWRGVGDKRWNLSFGHPLGSYQGKPSKTSIRRETLLVRETLAHREGGRPLLEFRVVRKEFKVDRTILEEF